MIINAEITAIIDAIRANTRRINELDKLIRQPFTRIPGETPEELHSRHQRHRAEYEAAKAEREALSIESKILHDNARRAVFDAVMPQAVEILRKYHGKQYGPRTAEKISDELKAACNCAIRLKWGEWLQDIDITPLNDNGFSGTCGFGYKDFYIYYPTDAHGNKHRILTAENRIDAADLKPDDLRLYDCHEYTENPREHARHILAELEKLNGQYAELERAITRFNNMLPSSVERRNISNYKTYI